MIVVKKYPAVDLDDVVHQHADGHYVQQSIPGPNPERDKRVSDALAKLKKDKPAAKVRP
ncbi:hypothetical protein [Paenibacillus sp. 1P07SE]|uniref:hypothetical protein n=1 Tax=Paenibacillus sp. 1P07SE TaxID=3132209 RepID=UPI0039A5D98E